MYNNFLEAARLVTFFNIFNVFRVTRLSKELGSSFQLKTIGGITVEFGFPGYIFFL